MTTNKNLILDQINLSDNQNSVRLKIKKNDMPLYNQANITRIQAINEIGNVILCLNMKPRIVKYTLELFKTLLPDDNTLPNTLDELFRAMISLKNNWRITQYLIRYKQCPSLASLSSSTSSAAADRDDDENELSPYDRLQLCLRSILDMNFNHQTALHNNNTLPLSDRRSQSSKRWRSETSSTMSSHNSYSIALQGMLKEFEDCSEEDENLCCFELNGYNLLTNSNKRRRYY